MIRRLRVALVIATLISIIGWLAPNAAQASTVNLAQRNCPPPSAPPQVTASPGVNRATVTWQAASGNGSQITAYVATAYNGSSPSTSVATDGNTLTASLFGLAGGTSYTFQVYAISSCGPGPGTSSTSVTPTGSSTTYATTVQANGPVAYYRLSELSGNTAADSSGSGAVGTYGSGGVTLGVPGAVLGDPDTAASWNGNCCGLLTSSPKLAYYNTARTIEGWIKPTDPYFRYVAGYGQNGQDQSFSVGVGPNQVGLITGNDDRYWSTHTLNDGNWHYLVLTYDGKKATAYVDGQSLGSQSYLNGINTLPGGLTIGGAYNGNGNFFNGALDEVAVYTKALSATSVANQFALAGYLRPSVPTNVNVTAGSNSATVTWSPPASGTQPLTGYVITAYQGTAAKNATATGGSASTATIYGLAGGTSYTLKVYASNAYGNGPKATTTSVTPTGSSTTYATTVQANGPVAYYRLSELTGNTAADSSGNGAVGTYGSGGVTLNVSGAVLGDPDTAASWNGNCCGLLSSSPKLAYYNTARTIEGWVKPTDPYFRYVAGYGQNGQDQSFSVGVGPNQVGLTTGNDDRYWSTYNLNDGNWHYLVVTYDGKNATAYIDGQSLGSQSYPNGINTLPGGLTVGGAYNGNGNFFNGALDEVAVYTKTLSATSVANQFALAGYLRPGVPTSVNVTAGSNSATVTWSPPASGTQPLTGYVITAYQGTTAKNATATGGSGSTATIYGLVGGVTYTFQIYASNAYGNGPGATTAPVTPTGASTTYATTVQTSGPVAYYRLSELSGNTAADSSGSGAVGTYGSGGLKLGVPGAVLGDPDTAASWNGNCCGLLSSSPKLAYYNTARTIEGWINSTDANFRYVAGYGQNGQDQSFSVGVGPTWVGLTTGNDDRYWGTHTLNDGKWHYIVVTYDGKKATAYVDGQSLGSQSYPNGIDTRPGGLTIGGAYNGNGNFFNGALDEVAVYAKALTASGIAKQFALAGYSRPGAPNVVTASYGGPNALNISWGVSNPNGSPVERYVITAYQGKIAKNATATAGNKTAVTISGLPGGVTYTFQVYASNAYGDSPVAVSTAVTTVGLPATYASTVQGDGAIAYYRLGEQSGLTMTDSSGHSGPGSYNSNVSLGQTGAILGDPSTAAFLGGNCCSLGSANPTLPLFNSQRTVEGWVKTTDGSFRFLAGWGQGPAYQSFSVGAGPNYVGVFNNNDNLYFTSSHLIADGNWHYVAVTYNGKNVVAYLDGQSLGTQQFSSQLDTLNSTLQVGAAYNGGSPINGSLDDVAIYPTALTAGQLSNHFQLGGYSRPGVPTNVVVTGGKNSATITWSPPTSGTQPLTGYVITAYQGKTATNATATSGSASTATIYGLAGGVNYTFQIYASNAYGNGPAATTSPVKPTGSSVTYASTVHSDGAIAYYRLSEPSGLTMPDSSGHGAPGSYNTNVTLGQSGALKNDPSTAVFLGGNCCSLGSANPKLPRYNTARTVEGWVKTTDGSFRFLAGWGQGQNDQAFNVGISSNQIGVITNNDDLYFATSQSINDGNWHYIVVTYDGTNVTAYLDGQSLGAQQFRNQLDTLSSTLQVGAAYNGSSPINGSLDDVAIYPTALSATQVAAHYHAGGY